MKKVWLAASIIVAAILMLAIAGCDDKDTISYTGSQQTGISVNGEGKVEAVPDLATINLGIEAQADTVSEARTQAADAMDRVMAALKAGGIEEKDIQTSQFSIYPVRQWNPETGEETLAGYRVTNMVTVKIRELDKAGQIIDSVAEAGGDITQVQGISFSVEDPKPYQAQAREEAFEDAKAKAEQMASIAGVTLGKPIFVTESGYYYPVSVPMASYAKDEAAGTITSISPGEQEISVNVQITYEIE
jgi:uncharacterized protein YggE